MPRLSIPTTLTPEQADLYAMGLIAAETESAVAKLGGGFFNEVHRFITADLGLTKLGNGIEKYAYALPSGRYVVKVQRDRTQSLTKEQKAMDRCRQKGLPVPDQHLVHPYVAMAERCDALNTLPADKFMALKDARRAARDAFAALGMGDQHDGNFGLRADGTVVAIDIGFGIPDSAPAPAPAPAVDPAFLPCDCEACRKFRAEEAARVAAVDAKRAALDADRKAKEWDAELARQRMEAFRARIAQQEAARKARREARAQMVRDVEAAILQVSGMDIS